MKSLLPLAMLAAALFAVLGNTATAAEETFYSGTYTKKDGSKGIYRFLLNLETGQITGGEIAAEAQNPTFLAIAPGGKTLYAASEVGSYKGQKTGAICAYAIKADGKLKPINEEASGGGGACHLSVDAAGKNVLVANYGAGTVSVLPIAKDGSVGPVSSAIKHEGKGPNAKRQEAPHAHGVYARGQFVYSCDLGTDQIDVCILDAENGTLKPNTPAFASVASGAGPRHLAFVKDHAYVINELFNTITVFQNDEGKGTLEKVQDISTLPVEFVGENTTAEIFAHPNKKFIYGSNRGHDSIAVFAIGDDGLLTLIQDVSTRGKGPRNFAIDPTGRWLIVPNERSNDLYVFKLDPDTGKLTPTGESVALGAPVCVVFAPLPVP